MEAIVAIEQSTHFAVSILTKNYVHQDPQVLQVFVMTSKT